MATRKRKVTIPYIRVCDIKQAKSSEEAEFLINEITEYLKARLVDMEIVGDIDLEDEAFNEAIVMVNDLIEECRDHFISEYGVNG